MLSSEVGHYGAALKRAPLTEVSAICGESMADSLSLTHDPYLCISQAQKSKCAALRSASWSNIALCHIQLKNYEQALSFADKVLAADPDNVKSLFRKGQCLMELNDLDDAKVSCCLDPIAKAKSKSSRSDASVLFASSVGRSSSDISRSRIEDFTERCKRCERHEEMEGAAQRRAEEAEECLCRRVRQEMMISADREDILKTR